MKRTRKAGSTGDDNNLENEFKRWYTENQGLSENTVPNYVNALNKAPVLVEELTGKKPASVFVIFEPNQFEDNYDILFRIKDWDGKPGKDLNDIKDKCLPETSDERISEIWRTKLKQNDPDTNERTNSGSLSAALGKYMDFLAFIWSRIPRNRIHFGAPGTGKSHQLKEAVEGKLGEGGKVIQDVEHNIGFFVDVDKDKKIVERRYERVTFYPTYSYAQFVGCYKPVMKATAKLIDEQNLVDGNELAEIFKNISAGTNKMVGMLVFPLEYYDSIDKIGGCDKVFDKIKEIYHEEVGVNDKNYCKFGFQAETERRRKHSVDDSESTIAYKFVPGPFLRVLVKALNNPWNHYCLVVEEINRANAAAVFGDVFQLLDRDSKSGESEYDVAVSEDVKKFLYEDKEGLTKAGKETLQRLAGEGRLKIPSNMYIWATMNSADQGVVPMDTAFKRRWEFEYFEINQSEKEIKDRKIGTNLMIDGEPAYDTAKWNDNMRNWNNVRKFVNRLLSLFKVNEDKLMGPWFVQPESGDEISAEQFESKVLMYLWEDAARMCRQKMFPNSVTSYSELITEWRKRGVGIFDHLMGDNQIGEKDKNTDNSATKLWSALDMPKQQQ